MKIAVLGCGPAGMMVAHACFRSQVGFTIFSEVVKPSVIGGAQYLHRAIPGLTNEQPDGHIKVVKYGNRAVYARKVYGYADAETSWDTFPEGDLSIWNLRMAYEQLWAGYSSKIQKALVTAEDLTALFYEYDAVFSTIPKRALCNNRQHQFEDQGVWIAAPDSVLPDNVMIYNGLGESWWYRASNIFGNASLEFPSHTNIDKARYIVKPLKNDCDCMAQLPVHLFGRYGQWQKGVLVDHAYLQAYETLGAML